MPLKVSDGMGAWVDDFKKSDAPQFKGKSEKERREMAIAAYMSAKRGDRNEATDNPPFTPDPPKPKAKNSDGSTTSPMSRARQLARQARDRSKEKDEGYVSHAQRKAVWANRADDGKGHPDKKKNESVEENYNWKVSHGSKDVHVKAPHAGAAVKKAQKGFGNMDLTKAKIKNLGKVGAPTNEATVDTANIASKKAMKQSDTEKLGKLADMLAKEKKPQKESAELDEAKYSWNDVNKALTKANYMRGNPAEISKVASKFDHKSGNDKKFSHSDVKKNLSAAGIDAARHHNVMKHMKESVELEEAHAYSKAADALRDYANKSGGIDKKDFHTAAKHLDNVGKSGLMQKGNHLAKFNNHLKYLDTDVRDRIHMTLKQHGVMEGTQLDELSPATHKSYQAKAFTSGARGMAAKRMGTMSAKDAYDNEKKRHAGIELSKSLQRRDARKKGNEEVEEAGSPERYKMIKKAGDKYNKEKKKAERDAMKAMSKDKDMMGENNSAPQSAAHRRAQMGSRYSDIMKKRQADNEKARQALKDPSHNPAWANSKSKTEETVSELKKSTLGSYVNKASKDAASKAYSAASAAKDNNTEKGGKDFSKSMKRLRGINTATKKLAKEDTNEAKSFDQKFKDHLKFATSKSPAVQDYLAKRKANRDAMNKKNDPNAAKKGYALTAVPPERKYQKLQKAKKAGKA